MGVSLIAPTNLKEVEAKMVSMTHSLFTQDETPTIAQLLDYIRKNPMFNILSMFNLTFKVVATKDNAMFFGYSNNFSVFETPLFYGKDPVDFVARDITVSDPLNKQTFKKFNNPEWGDTLLNNEWKEFQYRIIKQAKEYYETGTSQGVSINTANTILPIGLTETIFYVQGSLQDWVDVLQKRRNNFLNLETTSILEECYNVIVKELPFTRSLLG